ncbi:unnamed protein product [Pedinophyceae sp. YPF-701]|nr:unnamed protein product [Pedinophyceae sp. YPF-701]
MNFIPSIVFSGRRPGYVFSTGPHGTGYYVDRSQSQGLESADKPVERRTAAQLLADAERQSSRRTTAVQELDAKSIKKMCVALGRAHARNTEMRAKHADEPSKFMESELELDESLQRLATVASAPELYHELSLGGALPLITSLLNHENVDIAAGAVSLLQELTEADEAGEHQKQVKAFIEELVRHGVLEALVERLSAYKEEAGSEAAAVHATLSVVENLLDALGPSIADLLSERTSLVTWLVARVDPKKFKELDQVKELAGEMLAVMAQNSDAVKKDLGASGALVTLLRTINAYKKTDPQTLEEQEFMFSAFDSLLAALTLQANVDAFVQAEGVQLMLLVLRSKRAAGHGALRVLDFACARSPRACELLVELQGLRSVFAALMGKARLAKLIGEKPMDATQERRAVSIVCSLLQNLEDDSAAQERVLSKFVENEFQKCDQLVDILLSLHHDVERAVVRAVEGSFDPDAAQDDIEEVEDAREHAGYFELQQAAQIFGFVFASGDATIRKHLLLLLHQRSISMQAVRKPLLELYASIGESDAPVAGTVTRPRLKQILQGLGVRDDELHVQEGAILHRGRGSSPVPRATDGVGAADGRQRSRSPGRQG